MSHIDVMKQALEYLQDNQHLIADNERHAYVMEYNAFIERFEQAIADAEKRQALDKKADNARELGLSYEQPAQQDLPDVIAGALGVSRGTAYDMMREALVEQAAQQEPDHIEDVLAMIPPPECKTEAEKTAFAFGWYKALESVQGDKP